MAQTHSGWVTSFDTEERFAPLLKNMSHYETLWLVGPNVQNIGQVNWWTGSDIFKKIQERAHAEEVAIGPVLHNVTEKGFDPELGVQFLKKAKSVARALAHEVKSRQWKSLNIDLESLPASAAADYENFIKILLKELTPLKVRVSICLHAKESDQTNFEGAKFQRWDKLKKLNVDFVVMAYDHSWASSAPGPVAPTEWVQKVSEYALKEFGQNKTIIALPLFGYHWQKDAKVKSGWAGKPDIAPIFEKLVSDEKWEQDSSLGTVNGKLYKKGTDQVLAFDDESAFHGKLSILKVKKVKRFALWRLGAEKDSFYKKFESGNDKQ